MNVNRFSDLFFISVSLLGHVNNNLIFTFIQRMSDFHNQYQANMHMCEVVCVTACYCMCLYVLYMFTYVGMCIRNIFSVVFLFCP